MTPMTALPARPADVPVQGAARPGRQSSTREDLARSRDDFARTLERESTSDRGAVRDAGERSAVARGADARGVDRRGVDRRGPGELGVEGQDAREQATDGADPDASATVAPSTAALAPATPVAETAPLPGALAQLGLGGEVPPETGPADLASSGLAGAAPENVATAAAAGASAPVVAAAVLAAAAGATGSATAPVAATPDQAGAQPVAAATAAQTAPSAWTTSAGAVAAGSADRSAGTDPQGPSAPLVVDGSPVVLTGPTQPGSAAAPVAGTAPAGTPLAGVQRAAAADLSGGAPAAEATTTTDPSAVRGEGAPASTGSAPATPPAASFAQVLTAATDRVAAQAPATPANTPHVPLAEQVRGPLVALRTAAPGEHMLTLRVDPESLGPVQVRAHIGADGIRIELVGATDAARDSLRGLLTDLRRDLSATGMNATLSLAADTAGQQSRNPGAAADLFGGQQGSPGQRDAAGQTTAQRDRAAGGWTAPDQTTEARTAASTTHGARGVDVLV